MRGERERKAGREARESEGQKGGKRVLCVKIREREREREREKESGGNGST